MERSPREYDGAMAYQERQNITADHDIDHPKQFFNFRELNALQLKKWKSPFAHHKECDLNQKVHLQSNEYKNFEKSFKVSHALSLNTGINNAYKLWQRGQEGRGNQQGKRVKVVEEKSKSRGRESSLNGSRIKTYTRPRTQQNMVRPQHKVTTAQKLHS